MSFSIPNPFYEAAKKLYEARVQAEVARRLAASKPGCGGGAGCGHQPRFMRPSDRSDQPGLNKLLREVPTKTGIVYVNGQLQSVQPPGSNQPAMMAAGTPEVRPGESATYSSAADHVHYAGGCPHCGLTRGLDGNLYDARGVITTNVTTGCIPCECVQEEESQRYNCVDGECVAAEDGTYVNIVACQEACAWWYCGEEDGICYQDYELGVYETEAECDENCCVCYNVSAYRNTGDGYIIDELDMKWGGKTCVATPGPWNADTTPSRWISTGGPTAASTEPCDGSAIHTYSMTFTVSALPAELCFRFLVDDVADIILNGVTLDTMLGSYTSWTDYGVNEDDGLVVGTNILTFAVHDTACAITGLRVEFCPDSCSGWYCCEENNKVVPITGCGSSYNCSPSCDEITTGGNWYCVKCGDHPDYIDTILTAGSALEALQTCHPEASAPDGRVGGPYASEADARAACGCSDVFTPMWCVFCPGDPGYYGTAGDLATALEAYQYVCEDYDAISIPGGASATFIGYVDNATATNNCPP